MQVNIAFVVIIFSMRGKLYFWLAKYFRFFARPVLEKWQPKIVVVTGSAGKSTALSYFYELLKTQYTVKKTEHANSAVGIPLDILGIHLLNYTFWEWIKVLVLVPFNSLRYQLRPRLEKFYLVELDADRKGEMKFFAEFLKPVFVYWGSSYATHTANFDEESKILLKEQVADEYSLIVKAINDQGLAVVNGESVYIKKALENCQLPIIFLHKDNQLIGFNNYLPDFKETKLALHYNKEHLFVTIPHLLPEEICYTLSACLVLSNFFKISRENLLSIFVSVQPIPGRYSVFLGLKNTTLIDSSYNSSLLATIGMFNVLSRLNAKRKIAVLGDMRELGKLSEKEHLSLAKAIIQQKINQVVLVGQQTKDYVLPELLNNGYTLETVHHFTNTYAAGLFLKETLIQDEDLILIKASQNTLFFELIVEMLLLNKDDVSKLARRERIWENKRQQLKNNFYNSLKK